MNVSYLHSLLNIQKQDIQIMDLHDDPLIKEYIQNHNIKPNTIIRFTRGITLYSEFLDKTPEQWISEAEEQEEKWIRMRRRSIKKYLLDWKILNIMQLTIRLKL